MPQVLSRSSTLVVATLAALAISGCGESRDPQARLVSRTQRVVAGLERLQPKLARAGTPDADALAERLVAVRAGLAAMPPPDQPDPGLRSIPSRQPASVRSPESGGWRIGVQAEVGAWRVRLRGGGSEINDVGPAAEGVAAAAEQAIPIDPLAEWSWGGEAAATIQRRTGGQHIYLAGIRPVVRFSLAVADQVALTARPLLEVGQASVRLGSAPGGVIDKAGPYAGYGVRAGMRALTGSGDFTAELGWRQIVFLGSAGDIGYRVDAGGPEVAAGWNWSF